MKTVFCSCLRQQEAKLSLAYPTVLPHSSFGVTWRRQSRDDLTLHMSFHIGGPLERSLYLKPFYRAMQFSAKRGIAIACRLSVRPSVTLVDCDHIGWNSSKLVSPLVSLGCSLFATPTWRVCSKGNTPKFGPKVTNPPVDLSVGDIWSQIAAEWLQIAQRSQWRAYRKLPSLFRVVPSLRYDPPRFPPNWGYIYAPRSANGISAFRNGWSDTLHVWF